MLEAIPISLAKKSPFQIELKTQDGPEMIVDGTAFSNSKKSHEGPAWHITPMVVEKKTAEVAGMLLKEDADLDIEEVLRMAEAAVAEEAAALKATRVKGMPKENATVKKMIST